MHVQKFMYSRLRRVPGLVLRLVRGDSHNRISFKLDFAGDVGFTQYIPAAVALAELFGGSANQVVTTKILGILRQSWPKLEVSCIRGGGPVSL